MCCLWMKGESMMDRKANLYKIGSKYLEIPLILSLIHIYNRPHFIAISTVGAPPMPRVVTPLWSITTV